MKDLRLTLYDWLGYLIPGTIFLLSVVWAIQQIDEKIVYSLPIISSNFLVGFIAFCFAYMLGHLMHVIANITIDRLSYGGYPPQEYLDKEFNVDFNKVLLEQLIKKIAKGKPVNTETDKDQKEFIKQNYWYCYNAGFRENENSLAQIFLNLNGFYRGVTVSNFLSGLLIIIVSISRFNYSIVFFIGCFLLLTSVAFYYRARRFKIYLTRTVYTNFLEMERTDTEKMK